MGGQVQELKKQRKLLVFACSVLALLVFVAGIYAFVQQGIAVENEKKAIEAMRQTIECEKEARRQRAIAEQETANALRISQQMAKEALEKPSKSTDKRQK